MNSIPKTKHAVIRICKLVLNTDADITETDVLHVKQIFRDYLESGMSPSDIKNQYLIEHSNFGMFLKTCLNLKLLSVKDAINNYYKKKAGQRLTLRPFTINSVRSHSIRTRSRLYPDMKSY